MKEQIFLKNHYFLIYLFLFAESEVVMYVYLYFINILYTFILGIAHVYRRQNKSIYKVMVDKLNSILQDRFCYTLYICVCLYVCVLPYTTYLFMYLFMYLCMYS